MKQKSFSEMGKLSTAARRSPEHEKAKGGSNPVGTMLQLWDQRHFATNRREQNFDPAVADCRRMLPGRPSDETGKKRRRKAD